MKSKIAERIMSKTSEETKLFVKKYGDIMVRVHQILREKGITQKDLAERMGKSQSEISKWLSGEHNFTLRSLTRLEAELGVEIIYIPKRDAFHVQRGGQVKASAVKAKPIPNKILFQDVRKKTFVELVPPKAA